MDPEDDEVMRRSISPALGLLVLFSALSIPVGGQFPPTVYDLKGVYKRVTVAAENETIEGALRSVVDPKISLTFRSLDPERRISVKFDRTPRDQALATLACELDLFYEVSSPRDLVISQWSHLSKQQLIAPRSPDMQIPALVSGPAPEFPEVARVALFEGRVLIGISVGTDGSVAVGDLLQCDLNHTSHGPSDMNDDICPLFYSAASDALSKWKFEAPKQEGEYSVNLAFKFR